MTAHEHQSIAFKRRLALGFAVTILLALAIGIIGLNATFTISRDKDRILSEYSAEMYEVALLNSESERRVSASRAFLLTGDPGYLERMRQSHESFKAHLEILDRVETTLAGETQVQAVRELDAEYSRALNRLIELRKKRVSVGDLTAQFESEVQPRREALTLALQSYVSAKKQDLDHHFELSRERTNGIRQQILLLTAVACLVAAALSIATWRRLTRLYSELARSSRLREEILAMVSHDLKNPIHAIQLWIQLAERKDKTVTGLESLRSSVERMRGLVLGLLDFARIEEGQMKIEPSAVSAEDLVAETRKLFDPIAAARSQRLVTEIPAESPVLWADRERVLQVLSNLIGNAIKFTPPEGEVRVRVETEKDRVRFRVEDTGPGMPPEQVERVFDRFWQASRASRAGSGLGLAIAKGIVQAHQGRIWAESEPGRGSRFSFELPRAKLGA